MTRKKIHSNGKMPVNTEDRPTSEQTVAEHKPDSFPTVEEQSNITAVELHKSLNILIVSACFGVIFYTVYGNAPFNAYIRTLGEGDLVYSIILALSIFGSIVQILSSYILENSGKRKKMLIISGIFNRLPLVPVALVSLFVPSEMSTLRVWLIIGLVSMMSISGSFVSISFASWIGSLIPQTIRGRFFSKRMMVNTIAGALAALATGALLDALPGLRGYTVLFCIVAVLGLMDILSYIWVKEPFYEKPVIRIPILKLLKEPFKNRNYMRFVIFTTTWAFSANLAAPFFIVYMTEGLKMPFLLIMLSTQFVSSIATIVFIQFWGRLIDKYGNKPVLKICGIVMSFPPLIWLGVTPDTLFLIFLANFFGGSMWPAVDLATINLSIWLAPEKNRSVYYAFFSIIVMVFGAGTAYIAGGAVMEYTGPILHDSHIPFLFGQELSNFHILLILTFILRFLAMLFLPGLFHEENAKSARIVLGNFVKRISKQANNRQQNSDI